MGGDAGLEVGVTGRRGVGLVVALTVASAVASTGAAVAINLATAVEGRWPWGLGPVRAHPFAWAAGFTVLVAVAGIGVWWAERRAEQRAAELIPAVERPEPWVVERPAEVRDVVDVLCHRDAATVGITTALHGAGGFGKTTVARLIRGDGRVLRRFGGRVFWVTLGRDVVTRSAITAKVNDVIKRIAPDQPVTFTDSEQAGEHLGALLDVGPRRLLILDDVWHAEQLAPFTVGGRRCVRLVTTRNASLVPEHSVQVDQLSAAQARALLTWNLPHAPEDLVADLLAETGRWPLLLRLVNKILADQVRSTNLTTAMREVRDRLRHDGAQAVDELTSTTGQELDVGDPDQRARAIRATIEASTGLLTTAEQDRFAELAVFAEDEMIPVPLMARLWQATGGLDRLAARRLCARLEELALVTLSRTGDDDGVISLHDVIRDHLRTQVGPAREAALHQLLLDAIAAGLPEAAPLDTETLPDPAGTVTAAWWELADEDRYLWRHLVDHLLAAGRAAEAEALAGDLRWVAARLIRYGPAAANADLGRINTPHTGRLQLVLTQAAHLLGSIDPPHALIDVLHSRVGHDPFWGPQATALTHYYPAPRLLNQRLPPDLPHPALRRTITTGAEAVAICPGGTWLVTGHRDGTARIWDVATGRERAKLTGHTGPVETVAIAPDGTWLVTGSQDGTARIWDVATGRERAKLTGHTGPVETVAIAPDGTWLVTGSWDDTARIWGIDTGRERAQLTGHTDHVYAVAIAPDGTWLVTGSWDGTARIWDAATGRERAVLTGHAGWVSEVAIAPDGTWLVTGSWDGTARIWDAATGRERAVLTGHAEWVDAVAIAPDGTWLVTGDGAGVARIWDIDTGRERIRLVSPTRTVTGVAIAPDGTWLATLGFVGTVRIWDIPTGDGDGDEAARIWDVATGGEHAQLTGPTSPAATVAIAPDGTWLATGSWDGTVRIRDVAPGRERARLVGHTDQVAAVMIAPDGTWLATGSWDGTARIWDVATGRERAKLTGHTGPVETVAIAPDGTWLATGSQDGTARIWDVATGRERAKLTGNTGPVETVAIAPDGTWLATLDFLGAVRIWDVASGRERVRVTADTEPIDAVAIAPDGTWLATGIRDGTVRIWDVASGRERVRVTGHADRVAAVAIAPDGTWLATGSMDGMVRLWHSGTGGSPASMRIDGAIYTCTWTPDGKSVIVGGVAGLYFFTFCPPSHAPT